MTSRAAIEQALQGLPLTGDAIVRCNDCQRVVAEGHPCSAVAHRHSDESAWSILSAWCAGCAPSELEGDTLGAHEVLVEGDLATLSDQARQRHAPVLARVTVADYSCPDGSRAPRRASDVEAL